MPIAIFTVVVINSLGFNGYYRKKYFVWLITVEQIKFSRYFMFKGQFLYLVNITLSVYHIVIIIKSFHLFLEKSIPTHSTEQQIFFTRRYLPALSEYVAVSRFGYRSWYWTCSYWHDVLFRKEFRSGVYCSVSVKSITYLSGYEWLATFAKR